MKKVSILIFILLCSFYSIIAFAERVFIFDPNQHRWFAYEDGELVGEGRASGGKHYCPDVRRACRTPAGRFRIQAKRGADCYSNVFPINKDLPRAKMPYCSFFHHGYAIHGSNDVPNYNASHGCIRVPPGDARWLQQNFFSMGTTVIVKPYQQVREQPNNVNRKRDMRYYEEERWFYDDDRGFREEESW